MKIYLSNQVENYTTERFVSIVSTLQKKLNERGLCDEIVIIDAAAIPLKTHVSNSASIDELSCRIHNEDEEFFITSRIVILCSKDSILANKCKLANPLALWGASNGYISVIYCYYYANILHELCHLFGVEDCYDDDREPISECQSLNCVMRYGITDISDEQWLCDHAAAQLKN